MHLYEFRLIRTMSPGPFVRSFLLRVLVQCRISLAIKWPDKGQIAPIEGVLVRFWYGDDRKAKSDFGNIENALE